MPELRIKKKFIFLNIFYKNLLLTVFTVFNRYYYQIQSELTSVVPISFNPLFIHFYSACHQLWLQFRRRKRKKKKVLKEENSLLFILM